MRGSFSDIVEIYDNVKNTNTDMNIDSTGHLIWLLCNVLVNCQIGNKLGSDGNVPRNGSENMVLRGTKDY